MVSSGVWAGRIPLQQAHNLKEVGDGGQTMKSELERIGYLGKVPASFESWPIASHFELHIEQGPRLERAKKRVGVVTGVGSLALDCTHTHVRRCKLIVGTRSM